MTGIASGAMTLFLIILFLGIVFWAYSKRNKSAFDKMAQLPLAENESDDGKSEIHPNPPLQKEGVFQQHQQAAEGSPPLPQPFCKNGALGERGVFKASTTANKEANS